MTDSIVVLVAETDPEPREDVAAALLAAAEAAGIEATLVGPGEGAPAATVAFALDPTSLERAPAGAFRVALLPAFATDWHDPQADAVLVAHEEVAARLGARARRHVEVIGPVAPPGFALDGDATDDALVGAVVVLLPSAVMAVGPTPLFVQLSLVGAPASFLFDVGRDVELTDALRTFGTGHLGDESRVGLFSSDRQRALYRRADVVVGAGDVVALAAAFGAGTPVVALDAGASEALVATGAAVLAASGSMLSVAIDEALGRHDALAEAAGELEAAAGAERAIERGLALANAASAGEAPLAEGLPKGIEWLPTERELGEQLIRTAEGSGSKPPGEPPADEPSLEDKIEAELEALKKSLS